MSASTGSEQRYDISMRSTRMPFVNTLNDQIENQPDGRVKHQLQQDAGETAVMSRTSAAKRASGTRNDKCFLLGD